MEQENYFNSINASFVKTHPDAKLPTRGRPGDAGYDLTAVEYKIIPAKGSALVDVGITLADLSPTIWFLILPRSGLGFKHGIRPHLGTIDPNYRGPLSCKLYNDSDQDYQVSKGDRIAQIAYFPLLSPEHGWTEEIQQTNRGDSGFGSSGK